MRTGRTTIFTRAFLTALGGGALAALGAAGLNTAPGETILAVAVLSIVLTAP